MKPRKFKPYELLWFSKITGEDKEVDTKDHLTTLYFITKEFNLKRVLELGIRDTAYSTTALLQAVNEIDGKMTSVDIVDYSSDRSILEQRGLDTTRWNFIHSNALGLNWTEEIDHLYIDDKHEAEHVYQELRKFDPLVAKGGFITLHDTYNHNRYNQGARVVIGIEKFLSRVPNYEVYRYFNSYGLYILRKK